MKLVLCQKRRVYMRNVNMDMLGAVLQLGTILLCIILLIN
jgi:hypothetical protein